METTEIIAELRKVLTVGDSPVFCGGTFIPKHLAMEAADRLESLDRRWKRTVVERDQARQMRERAERLLGQAREEVLDLRKDIETLNRINEDWRDEVARLHQRIVEARDLGAKTAPVAEAAVKPGTNYVRIAKMGPWALADWIFRTGTICECCVRQGVCGIPEELVTEEYCLEHILMWLAQEVE